jgi:RNA polymerase-interacting CarD/CdnL/TRCF family regulator
MQRLAQEMMAAAQRGDIQRQQQLLQELLKLANDPNMPPESRRMLQQMQQMMGS